MICPGPIQTPFLYEGFTEKAGAVSDIFSFSFHKKLEPKKK